MAGTIYSGTYTTLIALTNPAAQRPATVTGTITNASGQGIFGNSDFAWTVDNQGTIESTGGTFSFGVQLLAGGVVNNESFSIGGGDPAGLIEGYRDGILIEFAPGTVSNFGQIEGTGTNGIGVNLFMGGGQVVNGSAAVTTALISGGSNAVVIAGGIGTVTNFGTISTTGTHVTVDLSAGGNVSNGSSTSTAALITGSGTGIAITGGAGMMTNFGTIQGSTGVFMLDGGSVTNGQSGSTTGLIVGTSGDAVGVARAAGTLTNFGTIQEIGTVSAVGLTAGGSVTNGAAGATAALITGTGTGVYVNKGPGTVTNFGRIMAISASSGAGIALEDGGSVSNFGTIQSIDTSDAGVYLRGGGSVTNGKTGADAGLILGGSNGVSLRGGVGTVANSGSIQGSAANGIYLGDGGRVTNEAGGVVAGPENGVFSRGNPVTVANSGSIESPGSNGIYITLGGSVTNQAGGVIAGHLNGIYSRGFAIAATNSGLIETTGTADGIYLRGGGIIINNTSGTITGNTAGIAIGQQGGTVTNRGLIDGVIGFYGGLHHSGNNRLINFGTVASTGGTAGVAVQMGNGDGRQMLIVEKGAVFTGLVEGGGRGEIKFAANGIAPMGANISGFNTVELANGGADSLTLVDANFSGVDERLVVIGSSDGNTVNASAVTTGQLTIEGGAGKDVLTGSANGGTIFVFTAAALTAADKLTGGGFNNELEMTTAGTIAAGGVSAVEIYRLADGAANSLTLTDANFTGLLSNTINVYAGTGGNTIDASGVTVAGHNLDIYGGAGTDVLKGGAGNDIFVFTAKNLTGTDTITGGSGNNELQMTTAGNVAAGGVSGVETYVLADGRPNTLSLTSGNFTGVTGAAVTISDGDNGNTVSLASAVPAADHIIVYAGTGLDKLTGGAGNDVFYAGGDTRMTGGAGANEFVFSAAGTNTIADFGISSTNELVFVSGSGFTLSGATPALQHLPTGDFVADETGTFTASGQRFAYDTSNGKLLYSATGAAGASEFVATLTSHPNINAATQLFFMS